MLKIAVVICTYNRYDLLPKAIDSVIKQDFPSEEYEILVIDNTPNAEQGEGLKYKAKYADIGNLTYVFEKTPGLSNARNVAMNMTTAQYVSYIDDDAITLENWLANVVSAFESFENVGVVGGKISPMWEIERPLWLSDKLTGHVSVVDWGGELRIATDEEWFAGANITFRKDILLESGGFSTSLGRVGSGNSLMSNEEVEVLKYIKKSGCNAVYAPEAAVDHLVERKRLRRDWFRRRVAWQATSDFIMDAEVAEARIPECLKNVKAYLASLPPLQRNLQGLYSTTEVPGEFIWQLGAIYDFTVLTLAGFEGLEDE
jgi:glycosyltransferase involved in cell wall biosynthesis